VGIVKEVAAVQIKMRVVLEGKVNGFFERFANASASRAQLVARHFGVIAIEMIVGSKDDANHGNRIPSPFPMREGESGQRMNARELFLSPERRAGFVFRGHFLAVL